MTLAEFKVTVAAYMQRDATSFVVGTTDLLTRSINMARRWAERQRNFELCKLAAYLPAVDTINGKALSATVKMSDRITPVAVKTVLKGYLPVTVGGIPNINPSFPIDVISREKLLMESQRAYGNVTQITNYAPPQQTSSFNGFRLVRWEEMVYITPNSPELLGAATINLGMDVVQWLPAYVATDSTDFFLEYCEDFMLFRTVAFLNTMIKEDQRVPISASFLKDSWQTVIAWDSSLISNSAEDANLD